MIDDPSTAAAGAIRFPQKMRNFLRPYTPKRLAATYNQRLGVRRFMDCRVIRGKRCDSCPPRRVGPDISKFMCPRKTVRNRRNRRRERDFRELQPVAFRNLYDAVNRDDTVTICIIVRRRLNRLVIQVSIVLPQADSSSADEIIVDKRYNTYVTLTCMFCLEIFLLWYIFELEIIITRRNIFNSI